MSFILGLVRLEAIEAGADILGDDDTFMRVNGTEVLNRDFGTGGVALADEFDPQTFVLNSPASVTLYDDDPWPTSNDFLGSASLGASSSDPIGVRVDHDPVTLSGSGSEYQLAYYTINLGNIPV
jgi:hypothetical protein